MFTVYGYYPEGHEDGHSDMPTLAEALAYMRDHLERETADADGPIFQRYALSFDRAEAAGIARLINGLGLLQSALADQDLERSLPEADRSALGQLREVIDALPDPAPQDPPQE